MSYYILNNSFFDPLKIAASGQAFRIHSIDEDHTELVAMGHYLQIASLGGGRYALSCTEEDYIRIWHGYFDLDRDYESIAESIDPSDSYLLRAASFGRGIRILKQEPVEAVISYIISQRRSIPSITTCVDRLCEKCGKKIVPPQFGSPFVKPLKETYYAFPDTESLSKMSLSDLVEIGAGYRAPYIISAIRDLTSGKVCIDALSELDDDRLYAVLTGMYGVGVKVANCVMLFGFGRCGRFPVDVWIQRIMDRYYGGSFDASRYEGTAGIMQQFMFYYERCEKTHLL